MLKEISLDTFQFLRSRSTDDRENHSGHASALPSETYYVIVDKNGVGIRGLGRVYNGRFDYFRYGYSLAGSLDFEEEIKEDPEVDYLKECLKKCPFSFHLYFGADTVYLDLGEGLYFHRVRGIHKLMDFEWEFSGKQELFNSLLVENNYSLKDWEELLLKIEDCAFSSMAFLYSPGRGLYVPGKMTSEEECW